MEDFDFDFEDTAMAPATEQEFLMENLCTKKGRDSGGYEPPATRSASKRWKRIHEQSMMLRLDEMHVIKKQNAQMSKEAARMIIRKIPVEVLAKEWLSKEDATVDMRAYLVDHVLPTLILGVERLLKEVDEKGLSTTNRFEPEFNPINFLAQYLMRNNPRFSNFAEASPYVRGLREVSEEIKQELFTFEDNRLARIKAEARRKRNEREKYEQLLREEKERRQEQLIFQFQEWNVPTDNNRVELSLLQNALRSFAEIAEQLPSELREVAKFGRPLEPTDETGRTLAVKEFAQYISLFVEDLPIEVFEQFMIHMSKCAAAHRAAAERENRRIILTNLFLLCDHGGLGTLDRLRILTLFEKYWDSIKGTSDPRGTLRNPRRWPVVEVEEVDDTMFDAWTEESEGGLTEQETKISDAQLEFIDMQLQRDIDSSVKADKAAREKWKMEQLSEKSEESRARFYKYNATDYLNLPSYPLTDTIEGPKKNLNIKENVGMFYHDLNAVSMSKTQEERNRLRNSYKMLLKKMREQRYGVEGSEFDLKASESGTLKSGVNVSVSKGESGAAKESKKVEREDSIIEVDENASCRTTRLTQDTSGNRNVNSARDSCSMSSNSEDDEDEDDDDIEEETSISLTDDSERLEETLSSTGETDTPIPSQTNRSRFGRVNRSAATDTDRNNNTKKGTDTSADEGTPDRHSGQGRGGKTGLKKVRFEKQWERASDWRKIEFQPQIRVRVLRRLPHQGAVDAATSPDMIRRHSFSPYYRLPPIGHLEGVGWSPGGIEAGQRAEGESSEVGEGGETQTVTATGDDGQKEEEESQVTNSEQVTEDEESKTAETVAVADSDVKEGGEQTKEEAGGEASQSDAVDGEKEGGEEPQKEKTDGETGTVEGVGVGVVTSGDQGAGTSDDVTIAAVSASDKAETQPVAGGEGEEAVEEKEKSDSVPAEELDVDITAELAANKSALKQIDPVTGATATGRASVTFAGNTAFDRERTDLEKKLPMDDPSSDQPGDTNVNKRIGDVNINSCQRVRNISVTTNSRSQSQMSAFGESTLNVSQFVQLVETFLGHHPYYPIFQKLVLFIKQGYQETEEEKTERLLKARKEAISAKRKVMMDHLFEKWDNDGSGYLEMDEVSELMLKFKDGQESDTITRAGTELRKKSKFHDARLSKREFRTFIELIIQELPGSESFDLFVEFLTNSVERSYAERIRGEARKKWLQQIVTASQVSGTAMDPVYKSVFQALYKDSETHGGGKRISASIAMLEKNKQEPVRGDLLLRYSACTPEDCQYMLGKTMFKNMKGVSFLAVEQGKPIHVPRVANHGNVYFWNYDRSPEDRDGSFIAVPLKDRKKRVFGIVGIDTLIDPHKKAIFITHEIHFFQGVAKAFSIAYHNVDIRRKLLRITESAISWIQRRCPHIAEITVYLVEANLKNVGGDPVLRKMMTTDKKGSAVQVSEVIRLERKDNLFRDYLFKCMDNSETVVADAYGERHTAFPLRDITGKAVGVVDISIGTMKKLPLYENKEAQRMLRLLQQAHREITKEAEGDETKRVLEAEEDDNTRMDIMFDRIMLMELRENVSRLDPQSFAELKSYYEPPRIIIDILRATLAVFKVDAVAEGEYSDWNDIKNCINNDLIQQIKSYDPTVAANLIETEKVEKYLKAVPHGEVGKYGSIPAQQLYNWVFVCLSLIEHTRKMRENAEGNVMVAAGEEEGAATATQPATPAQ